MLKVSKHIYVTEKYKTYKQLSLTLIPMENKFVLFFLATEDFSSKLHQQEKARVFKKISSVNKQTKFL